MNRAATHSPTRLAAFSFIVSMIVLGVKAAAWWRTESVVLLADTVESGLDGVTALVLFFAVTYSARPADDGHPFGHGKVEYFSAGFQGALVLMAGIGIGVRVVGSLLAGPRALELSGGLPLSALATAINLGLAVTLIRAGRALRSPALQADGRHNATDVVTTIGGWVGLGLAWSTGWWVLDPLVAIAVAAQILWTGFGLVRSSVQGLMDAALPERELRGLIAAFDRVLADRPAHYVRLRTRQSSQHAFVDLVLQVPGTMTVEASHTLCDALEDAAQEVLHGAEVSIHVDPQP